MSSDARAGSGWHRWRAPVIGAAAGLAVAAAIVGPAALADSGGNAGAAAKAKAAGAPGTAAPHVAKQRGTPAPGGVPHQFTDAIAQLVQAGTINAAQGRALDAQIETGSMDPQRMVSRGVLTAAQMAAVNDRLVAVKKSLAGSPPQEGVSPAAAACGKGAGQPPAA
jgi:hypothetical protein